MSDQPKVCFYCDGEGNSDADGECGFCDRGKPLDAQSGWDRTWGPILDMGKRDDECWS